MSTTSEKKDLVLKTTLSLVTTRGFYDTPMSLIAKESGVATGTIYHHFSSKEDLINHLYAITKRRMGTAITQGQIHESNFKNRFFLFWNNLYNHFLTNPDEFRFLEQYANSPLVNDDVKLKNRIHYQPMLIFFQQGIDAGVFRDIPLVLMVNLVYGHVASTVKLALADELTIQPNILQQAIQSSWDGIKIN